MLVFISDLHFLDETTGKHNLPKSAFEKFLSSVEIHAKKAEKLKVLKIVFLGDIFDLLRSEKWFEEKEEDRPWGNNTSKMKERANSILESIIEKNRDTFELFSKKSLKERFGEIDVENIYIPGNHDRLCWMVDPLREKVTGLLDLNKENNDNFKHYFSDSDHGVYALHGHIFDSFNYEGGSLHTKQDYKLVPIGDSITTEILIKIPYKLAQKIKLTEILSEKEKVQLIKNFQEIGNIRPYSAIFGWLLYQVKVNEPISEMIENTIDEVMREFNRLEFVKNWYKKHDTLHPLDIADKIQYITLGLERCKVLPIKKIPGFIINWIIKKFSSESDIKGALKLFGTLGDNIHYIIMGHTHNALQQSLFTESLENKRIRESVYLNTGTWIKNYYECKEYNGFVGWKNMNYVIVYTPDEKPNKYNLPVFETWQGTEKRED
jgi:UDP-2,3-diacylglucosamine pyrophosphatase LpxH